MGLALLGALLIGVSLGLLGSGGSILTVPVLTYLVGQEEKVAIAGSLAVVAAISLVAGIPYARRGSVDVRSVAWFGVPGMAGAYGGAWASQFVGGEVQLLCFGALMLAAGGLMLRRPPEATGERREAWRIVLDGLVVGAVTGFVGVGGGFLIVPALVLMGGLTMHRAVGTSLFIIALKSTAGFVKYLDVLEGEGLALDVRVLALIAVVGIAGSFAGGALGSRLPQASVRRIFAFGLFGVATFVVVDSARSLSRGDSPDPNPAVERAVAAKDALARRLGAELVAAIDAEGHAAAIAVCSERAPAIAADVARERSVRIGRASARLRNPRNVAPAWAADLVADPSTAVEPHLDAVEGGGLHALFPIPAAGLCMPCHGAPESIDPEVRAALEERYPGDRATGYAPGDLRGWFWVEVP